MSEPIYSTIKRNLTTGEVEFPLVLARGREAVRHRIHSRFQFFKGEWFLDQRKGAPFYDRLLKKNPDREVVEYLLRKIILRTPGVLTLTRFDVTFDKKIRRASIRFEAKLSNGEVLRSKDDEYIIVFP